MTQVNNITKNMILTPLNLLYKIAPELTLKIIFRLKTGYKLNLENPKTYNEKLQWIKLYDRDPLMAICADKYMVRHFVESQGCEGILNELLWEGFNPDDIPFDTLPNQFVIKVTHGSTFNIICKNKEELNISRTNRKLKKWLNANFLTCYGEWFYGVEKPRIIIEKYLENENQSPLFDYKIFCFNGEPEMLYVDTWKDGDHAINVYDLDFNFLPEVTLGYDNDPAAIIEKPKNFDLMLEYAKKLSKPFSHVRVDLYNIKNDIIFGELTFTKGAGFDKIRPYEFDVEMGNMLDLNNDQIKKMIS